MRKLCGCKRTRWPKCPHPWHFNFKPKGRPAYRFSLDAEFGEHIDSKTKAETLAGDLRTAIRNGTFRRRSEVPAETPPSPDTNALSKFIDTYTERCAKPVSANDRGCLKKFSAFVVDGRTLGDIPIGHLTEDTVEVFFASLQQSGRAASTRNKYVQAVKAMFRWAVKKGYLSRNPVAESESIKREKHAKRNRRLVPDVVNEKGQIEREGEERRLLAVAGPHLQRPIIAALETGMRRGELLNLQWRDVDLNKKEITVRVETTKTRTARILPMSTKLASILEMAHTSLLNVLKSGPASD